MDAPYVAADHDGVKAHRAGTHRTCEPEATLVALHPHMAALGVTRLAMLTGLDTIGIPVAAAMRPNSRSIAAHQGKGLTVAAAKVSALMEAAECFHAETLMRPMHLLSYAEMAALGPTADPITLPRTGRGDAGARLLWIEARDLATDTLLFVPHELVSADFTAPVPAGSGVFQASTNGLASGNHWLEAVTHGLYEVIERDAVALWNAVGPALQDARAIDPRSVDDPDCAALLQRFAAADVAVRMWDLTSDIRLPVFQCLAVSPDGAVEAELGHGCHTDRGIALARALTEAAQARLTRISGARDDFVPASFDARARGLRQAAARRHLAAPARRDFAAAPSRAGRTLRDDLRTILSCLDEAGLHRAAWIDLTRPEFPIQVARVIVPGLEGVWCPPGGEYQPGPRARAMSAQWA